ncbi:hypothetical protein [Desulfoluna spongiiphila]|uniref:Uncharacterized protein n=1 Tax=Desulfoluna spongiiphila TaxID=419481 RepID=A0A1G5BNY1_9BACT|nr:hypothetical protein [Desulfoluna spongiiphila]SCX91851.1 hypothetical protein SAMN05216233_102119 [Desulfoluna spongiiphila]VVS93837.1 hypothetical protein DBB_34090 [Desulfoluna spongiiphila]
MGKAKTKRVFSFKRCPYCFTSLSLAAETCQSCHKRVGTVDRYGLAKKPINYMGYLAAVMWAGIFVGYIWFAFIR